MVYFHPLLHPSSNEFDYINKRDDKNKIRDKYENIFYMNY